MPLGIDISLCPSKGCCLPFSLHLCKSHCLAAGEGHLMVHSFLCIAAAQAGLGLCLCAPVCSAPWRFAPIKPVGKSPPEISDNGISLRALSNSLRPPSGHFFLTFFFSFFFFQGSQRQHQPLRKASIVIKRCNRVLPSIRQPHHLGASHTTVLSQILISARKKRICEGNGLQQF